MRAKISDVAKMAGVSTATVSHVINGTRRVKEETKERVETAIEKLNYLPNPSARSFKTGQTHLIGFIVPDISNVYFATLIEQIEDVIAPQGYNLVIVNTKESIEREIQAIASMTSGLVDGIVIASTAKDYSDIGPLLPPQFPVLFVDREVPHCINSTITITCERAVSEAVNHLICQGHQKIGYIAGLAHLSTTKERLNAYKKAFSVNPSYYDESLICFADSMRNSANRCVSHLLDKHCSAIIVSNSIMTDDVLRYLNFNKDVTIVGFVDSPTSDFSPYAISFVEQPTLEMGTFAGMQIIQKIQDPYAKPRDSFFYSVFRKNTPLNRL